MRLNWDDYRLLLAVARGRSATKAAEALGVTTSTVTRRLERLREVSGTTFFEGMGGALEPTQAGAYAIEAAEAMEAAVLGAERRLEDADLPLDGTLRITTAQTLYSYLLRPGLRTLTTRYPKLQLDVQVTDEIESLARGAADVAVRTEFSPSDALVGVRIGTIGYRLYASEEYFARRPSTDSHEFITWTHVDGTPPWVAKHLPNARCSVRVGSHRTMIEAALDGHGVASLPVYVGDSEPELVPLGDIPAEDSWDLWLLTHEQLRQSARVRAFFDVVGQSLRNRSLR